MASTLPQVSAPSAFGRGVLALPACLGGVLLDQLDHCGELLGESPTLLVGPARVSPAVLELKRRATRGDHRRLRANALPRVLGCLELLLRDLFALVVLLGEQERERVLPDVDTERRRLGVRLAELLPASGCLVGERRSPSDVSDLLGYLNRRSR